MSCLVVFRCSATIEMEAFGPADANDLFSVASIALEAAIAAADRCGCHGCREALPNLRGALDLVGACDSAVSPPIGRA